MSDDRDSRLLNSERFRGRVKAIVSENEYWREIVKSFQIEQRVREEVDRQLQSAKSTLSTLGSRISDDIQRNLPGQVAQQIMQQMPGYLNDNATMKGLLSQHEAHIKEQLETKARDILKGIVEDPNYHVINQVYFDAFRSQGDAAISQLQQKAHTVQSNLEGRVDERLRTITELQIRMANLENQNWWQTVGLISLTVASSVFGFLYLNKK